MRAEHQQRHSEYCARQSSQNVERNGSGSSFSSYPVRGEVEAYLHKSQMQMTMMITTRAPKMMYSKDPMTSTGLKTVSLMPPTTSARNIVQRKKAYRGRQR